MLYLSESNVTRIKERRCTIVRKKLHSGFKTIRETLELNSIFYQSKIHISNLILMCV